MSLEALIAQVQAQEGRARTLVTDALHPGTGAIDQVRSALVRAEEKLEGREEQRLRKLLGRVNLDTVRDRCVTGTAKTLSRREQRAVVAGFALLGPDVVEAGIRALPELRGLYARRLFRQWAGNAQGAHWDRFVDFLPDLTGADAPVKGLPLSCNALLRVAGPGVLAQTWSAVALEDVASRLRAAGMKPRWAFYRVTLLAWAEQNRSSGPLLARALAWVMATPEARLQLVPRLKEDDFSISTDAQVQASFAAVVLGARADGTLSDAEVQRYEAQLVAPQAEFGDPRLGLSQRWWDAVKQKSPRGVEALLERLGTRG